MLAIEIEEMVKRIQGGEKKLIPDLWDKIKRFAYREARVYYSRLPVPLCDIEDLEQSGFIAMIRAVEGYTHVHDAKFITYLRFHLFAEFNAASGWRRFRDAILYAKSLNDAVGEEDGAEVVDLIEDKSAAQALEDAEGRIYNEQLHAKLEEALSTLRPAEADVIRRIFYSGESINDIAAGYGTHKNAIYQTRNAGIQHIRISRHYRDLAQFLYDSTPWYGKGFRPTENAVMAREDLKDRVIKFLTE